MTYVTLKGGSSPIKVKEGEPALLLKTRFPDYTNTIGGVTFYDNHITFKTQRGNEMYVPLSSVLSVEYIIPEEMKND